ncbi:DapH/DapD/GlmU-related protein [Bacillus sp. FDAARGOS_1420]|uniref:acyltransferase n=1 Tax=unclassified Bacillus (in: firmicutes) TaxID=185979 RepID=UPI001C5AA7C8|nr:acyltransferase [Bacillus sp. FDAARGOS_1420]MBW3496671.1 acyltransferase [Bacillus sp. FDAARGOS_1420]
MRLKTFFQRNGYVLGFFRLYTRSFIKILNVLNTIRWRLVGIRLGKGSKIQVGTKIENPKQIVLGENCLIASGTVIDSENNEGKLILKNNVQINKGVRLDHTGNLIIHDNVLVSEYSTIYTHSHGYKPRSKPIPQGLIIKENTWIGSHSIILSGINEIGSNAIVASGSIVTKTIESKSVYGGNPAKYIKSL